MDYLNKYITNPVVKIGSFFSTAANRSSKEKVVETIIKHEYQQLEPFSYKQLPRVSKLFLRCAAISGLTAVAMSAYGSHSMLKIV
jgi:hypothetical protein